MSAYRRAGKDEEDENDEAQMKERVLCDFFFFLKSEFI